MRTVALMLILSAGCATTTTPVFGAELIATCALGVDRNHTLALLRDHPIDRTAVYYLSKDGATPVRLYEGDEDQSRGEDVEIACVGDKERALVISGEFTSNYLQGVAFRYNTNARRWERINFAERSRPTTVYFDAAGMTVLIPNGTRNESGQRYILYRQEDGTGRSEQTYSDRRPKSPGTEIRATRIQ